MSDDARAAGPGQRVEPDDGALDRLEAIAKAVSPVLARSKVLARQACYRPIMRHSLPIIGAIPGTAGAYGATGHSVWGFLNAPATGEAMAELLLDGEAKPYRFGRSTLHAFPAS